MKSTNEKWRFEENKYKAVSANFFEENRFEICQQNKCNIPVASSS